MPRNDVLWKRLETARTEELNSLADVVGLDHRGKSRNMLVEGLSAGIRKAAGHSIRNLFRGPHDFSYKQLLIDVADKMAPGYTPLSWTPFKLSDKHCELDIEECIWELYQKAVGKQVDGMSEQDRQALQEKAVIDLKERGFTGEMIEVAVTSAIVLPLARLLIVPLAVSQFFMKTNYRKTIPAAIQLIQIRKRAELEKEPADHPKQPNAG